jgi:tetratricopeptide (TPR) repeat protein
MHQYAAERLEAGGGSHDARRRHARHFAALAERAERGLLTPEMGLWLRRLEADHDNFRAALSWSLEHEPPETSLRFARALGIFWSKRGYLREGREWLDRLLARCAHAAPEHRAKALVPAGWFARVLGEYGQATALNEDALDLCRLVDDRPGLAEVLNQRGAVALYTCDLARARTCFDESLALADELRERWARTIPLVFLAHTAAFDLEWNARARANAEEALALFTEVDDRSGGAHAHIVLGLGAHLEGDDAGALAHLDQAVMLCRQAADQRQLAISMGVSSLMLHFLGRWAEALPLAREALRTALDLGEKTVAAQAYQFLALLANDQGHAGRAVRLMGYARSWGEAFGFRLAPMMRAFIDPELAAMRAHLGEAASEEAWEAGRAMSAEQALACASGAED